MLNTYDLLHNYTQLLFFWNVPDQNTHTHDKLLNYLEWPDVDEEENDDGISGGLPSVHRTGYTSVKLLKLADATKEQIWINYTCHYLT